MKKMIIILTILLNAAVNAQYVKLGIYSEENNIEVKIVSETQRYSIFDYLSDLLVIVRWSSAENTSLGLPVSTYYSVIKTGGELVSGDYIYQKFVLSGGNAFQLPQPWEPGFEYSLFSVPFDTVNNPAPIFELAPVDFIDLNPNIAVNMIDILNLDDPYFKKTTVDSPVPVELISFAASGFNNKIELNWLTSTEINNAGFEVQRTTKENEEEWKTISFVEGAGNSTEPIKYSYTDKNPVGGTAFIYRLKQIDFDGTFAYSDIVEVEMVPAEYELSQNYPNPFNPTTKIKFSLRENQHVSLKIYNQLGEEVAEVLNKEYEAGYHEFEFNGSNLASGVYFYRLSAGSFDAVKKMMLIK